MRVKSASKVFFTNSPIVSRPDHGFSSPGPIWNGLILPFPSIVHFLALQESFSSELIFLLRSTMFSKLETKRKGKYKKTIENNKKKSARKSNRPRKSERAVKSWTGERFCRCQCLLCRFRRLPFLTFSNVCFVTTLNFIFVR